MKKNKMKVIFDETRKGYTVETGNIREDGEDCSRNLVCKEMFYVKHNVVLDDSYTAVCKHCVKERNKIIRPNTLVVFDDFDAVGGYAQVAVCLDCVIEANSIIKKRGREYIEQSNVLKENKTRSKK